MGLMDNRNWTRIWTLIAVILIFGNEGGLLFDAVTAQQCVDNALTDNDEAVLHELLYDCPFTLVAAAEFCLGCKQDHWKYCCASDAHNCTLLCSNTTIIQ